MVMLWNCMRTSETLIDQVQNDSGTLTASLILHNCGATCSFVHIVRVKPQKRFARQSTVLSIRHIGDPHNLRIRWDADTLIVELPEEFEDYDVFIKEESLTVGGKEIEVIYYEHYQIRLD